MVVVFTPAPSLSVVFRAADGEFSMILWTTEIKNYERRRTKIGVQCRTATTMARSPLDVVNTKPIRTMTTNVPGRKTSCLFSHLSAARPLLISFEISMMTQLHRHTLAGIGAY